MTENREFPKLWIRKVGVFAVLYMFLMVTSVNSLKDTENDPNVEEVVAQNQTELIINNVNATELLMKRAGEFASRVLWVKKRKFVFPTGTILTIAPKITVPAFRQKAFKGALNSDIQATWFLYMNLDKMGYTDDMHPFPFDRPPFYPFGPLMRRIEPKDGFKKKDKDKESSPSSGPMHHGDPSLQRPTKHESDYKTLKDDKATTVYTYFPINKRKGGDGAQKEEEKPKVKNYRRKPRAVMSMPPPETLPGGERASLLPRIENIMSGFGFEGRGCMLRAICEIHEYPMQNGYGLLGEMVALFFSISESPYAESHMPEYLRAEVSGRAGNCEEYKKQCAKSVFKWEVEKKHKSELDDNEVPVSLYKSKYSDYDEL